MKQRLLGLLVFGSAAAIHAAPLLAPRPTAGQGQEELRDVSDLNLEKGLAIGGHDPVAYFPEGGAEPTKGKKALVLVHQKVTYRFASEENRELFELTPAKYEPMYGGWCAYTLAVEVVGGALLLTGLFARLGGLLALGSMAGALYAHLSFDWPGEPPLAVLVFAALVVWGGAGSFALGGQSAGDEG